MKIGKIVLIGLLCFAMHSAFEGISAGAQAVRGVTKDSIRIGINVPLTKILANAGRHAAAAYEAYTQYINDNGGIHGRKLVLVIDDSQFDPSISLGIFKKQITTDNIFAHISWGAPPSGVLIKPAMDEKIPLVISSTIKPWVVPPKKYVLCCTTPFEIQTATCLTYVHDVLKKKDAKIGVFWRNDDYGRTILAGAKEAADYYKYEVVAEPSFIAGQSVDFTSEVMKLKRAKAEFAIVGASAGDLVGFLREAKNQGLKATIFGGAGPGSERKIIFQAGAAAENYISSFGTAMFKETNVPGVKEMIDISKKYKVPEDILSEESFYYSMTFFQYMLFVEALKIAGPNPTQDNYIAASEKIKDYTADGLGPKSYYTPARHWNSDDCFLGQVEMKSQNFRRITDWTSPPRELIEKLGYK